MRISERPARLRAAPRGVLCCTSRQRTSIRSRHRLGTTGARTLSVSTRRLATRIFFQHYHRPTEMLGVL